MIDEPDPGALIEDGLKLAVAPVGRPDAVSLIAELNPLKTVVLIVLVTEDPGATDTDDGEAEIEKRAGICGGGATTCTTEDPLTV